MLCRLVCGQSCYRLQLAVHTRQAQCTSTWRRTWLLLWEHYDQHTTYLFLFLFFVSNLGIVLFYFSTTCLLFMVLVYSEVHFVGRSCLQQLFVSGPLSETPDTEHSHHNPYKIQNTLPARLTLLWWFPAGFW